MFESRQRSVVLQDIDHSAYPGWLVRPLIEAQLKANIISETTRNLIDADVKSYEDGNVEYGVMAQAVLTHWAEGLAGKSFRRVKRHTKKFLKEKGNEFYPYVNEVRDNLRRSHRTVFVTAEPQFVGQAAKEVYRFNEQISTVFEIKRGKFTGKIKQTLGGNAKKDAIKHLVNNDDSNSIAFGDSSGDIGMLEAVNHPVIISPDSQISDPVLANLQQTNNWPVVKPEDVMSHVRSLNIAESPARRRFFRK